MSRISRYKFLKKIFNNYIVLIYKDSKYYTYGIDAYMYYRKCNKDIKKIERLKINYIIVDGLEEIEKNVYKNHKLSLESLFSSLSNYYNSFEYDKHIVKSIIDEELENF